MNLESLFEKYLREYLVTNKGIIGRLEDKLPAIYEKWAGMPNSELGGMTPRAYVDNVADADELVALTISAVARGGEPAPVAIDRLEKMPNAAPALIKILDGAGDEKVRTVAVELLDRMNKLPLVDCVDIVFDPDTPELLRETLVERLKYDGDAIKQLLLARIGETEGEAKKILAEMLVDSGVTDDRVFTLLCELLADRANLPLACQLLADYGDSRAIELLSALSSECVYADYIELRNAVERLGGDLPLRLNWENDPTYKKIRGND